MGHVSDGDLPYVSPLPTYLDLKDHPERSSEAAEYLRPIVLQRAAVNG